MILIFSCIRHLRLSSFLPPLCLAFDWRLASRYHPLFTTCQPPGVWYLDRLITAPLDL